MYINVQSIQDSIQDSKEVTQNKVVHTKLFTSKTALFIFRAMNWNTFKTHFHLFIKKPPPPTELKYLYTYAQVIIIFRVCWQQGLFHADWIIISSGKLY